MKTRCFVSIILVIIFVLLSQPAIADDLAELKATHQRVVNAWNTGDLDSIFEIWQDGAIWLAYSHDFPMVLNSAILKPMLSKWLETHTFRGMPYKTDYRIIGNTGLVWGLRWDMSISKTTGAGVNRHYKTSAVYIKSEGKWKSVMMHSSLISEYKFE